MRHGKRLIKTQSSVQIVAQRSFHNSRATNRLIAVAAIIVVILITATCSVFFNLQNFSTLQTLKSYGTTTEIIFSNPSTAQLTKLEESNLVQKPLYTSYRLGRLIGNPGQSGLSIDLWAVENWDTWSSPLVSNLQGHYPVEAGEVMLSTWLLERFEIEPVIGTEITFSVGWDDCDAVQEETFYLCGFYTDTSYIDTTSKQKVFLSAAVLAQHELPASIAGFSVSAGSGQRDLNQVINQLGLTEQQTVTVLSAGKMSLQDMVLALAVILFFMVDGFLIIFNINSISVTKDIQFYGLLKTIGISPKQLKRVIYYRMTRILLMALPTGLLLGCIITQWIVPLLLGNLLEGFTQANLHWAVPVVSALFSCAMIFVSFAMTARKVLAVSPMAALRYTEESIKRKTSRSSDHATLPWMGLRNAFRHPTKAHQGDMITFFVMDTDQQFQLPIGGQFPLERDGMNGGAAPWLVVSNKVIDQYRPDAIIYSIKIDSKPKYEQNILDQVMSLTEHIPAISRTSKIELAQSLAEVKDSLSKLSIFLTVVLFSIGILNFINTMSANVLNRQREFAAMEAVGATKRQVCQLVVWEGFWYFVSTMILVLTFGSVADVLLFGLIQNSLEFGVFSYPVLPLVLYLLATLIPCGIIPPGIYRKVGMESIIQRLRED